MTVINFSILIYIIDIQSSLVDKEKNKTDSIMFYYFVPPKLKDILCKLDQAPFLPPCMVSSDQVSVISRLTRFCE